MSTHSREHRLLGLKGEPEQASAQSAENVKETSDADFLDSLAGAAKLRIQKSEGKMQNTPKAVAESSLAKLKEQSGTSKTEPNRLKVVTETTQPSGAISATSTKPPMAVTAPTEVAGPVAAEPATPAPAERGAEALAPEREALRARSEGVQKALVARVQAASSPTANPALQAAKDTLQSLLSLVTEHAAVLAGPTALDPRVAQEITEDLAAAEQVLQVAPEVGGAENLRKRVAEFEAQIRAGTALSPEAVQAIEGLLQGIIVEFGAGSPEAVRFQSLLQLLPLIQNSEQIAEQRQQAEKAVRQLYSRYSGYGPIEAAERNVELARQDRNETQLNPIARLSGTHAGRQSTLEADQQRLDRLNGLRTQLIAERASFLDTNTNPAERLLRLQSLVRAADNVNYTAADAQLTGAIASLDRTDRIIRTVADFVPGGSLGVAIAEVRMNPGPDAYKRLAGAVASTALDLVPVGRIANVAARLGRAGGPAARFVLNTGIATAQVALENPGASGQDYALATINAATKSRMERARSHSRSGTIV